MRSRLIIPCDNKRIQEQMAQVDTAIAQLTAMDFSVDRVESDGYQRPNIRVHYDNRVVRSRNGARPFAMAPAMMAGVIMHGGRFR